ncbi:MAG: glycosyltransferase [Candidatus Zhuqueibacterota bacterium]
MIFVSVGTNTLPFDRLVKEADSIAKESDETFFIQRGHSPYKPVHAKYFDFCEPQNMIHYIEEAEIVISHAGFGIIGDCIVRNKRLILVPREYEYGEAVDKQLELAEYLANTEQSIICVRDVAKLKNAITQIRNIQPKYKFETKIPETVRDFVNKNFLRLYL